MATSTQLRQFITARPFQPFVIRMASGRAFTIKHPENAACDLRGREATIYDDDGAHLVEMILVEVMEAVAVADPQPGPNGP